MNKLLHMTRDLTDIIKNLDMGRLPEMTQVGQMNHLNSP